MSDKVVDFQEKLKGNFSWRGYLKGGIFFIILLVLLVVSVDERLYRKRR